MKNLGFGVGLRFPHIDQIIEEQPAIDWLEVISENLMGVAFGPGGRPFHRVEKVRQNYPMVMHGVALSIGSTDPLNTKYLKRLGQLINELEPVYVSDHLCWTGVNHHNIHDLLPVPFTKSSLENIVSKLHQVQDALGRTFTLENVSSYFTYQNPEYTEWDFIAEISKKSGCTLLLDVNNVYVSSRNHGFDAKEYIRGIPSERVVQYHLAGYHDCGTHIIDTHDHPVSDPVWDLFKYTLETVGSRSTLIEWDAEIPSLERLLEESAKAREVQEKVHARGYQISSTDHSISTT